MINEVIKAAISLAGIQHNPLAQTSIPILKKYVDRCSVVYNVGACDGDDIVVINNCWEEALIHAFEPDPDNYQKLIKYQCEYIHCNSVALSDQIGTVTFNQVMDRNVSFNDRSDWFRTAGSLLHNGTMHLDIMPNLIECPIEVQSITIDEYCRNADKPDVLIIDTQGSEYQILAGARESLSGVNGILVEWSTKELYEGQKYLSDIEALLSDYGFTMVEKINLWGDWHGDAIFVKHA